MQVSKIELKTFQISGFKTLFNVLKNYTKRAYFVGGSVRDFFLFGGMSKPKDIDIEVYDINPEIFEKIMLGIGAKGVGKSFFVYKFENFDIALARSENKIGVGHKAFEVEVCNDERMAVKRRDFSINAVMINIFTGEICDFYGGVADIRARVLRMVCEKTFVEDSLRVLRGVQFCARFNLKIEQNTLKIMQKIKLDDLSKDRIRDELVKLFRAKFLAHGFKILQILGLDEKIFGVKISDKQNKKITGILKNSAKIVQNEMFFLYIILNFLHLDKLKILRSLNLNSVYKRILNEPFYERVSSLALCEISSKIPLKSWLGMYSAHRVKMAKSLRIYDNRLHFKVSGDKFVKIGLKGIKIATAIKNERSKKIRKHINKIKNLKNSL